MNHRSDYVQSPLHTHLMPCRMQYLPPAAAQRHPEVQWHYKNHHKLEAEILLNIDLHITAEELRSLKLQTSLVLPKTQIHNSKVNICHFKPLLPARFRVTEALFVPRNAGTHLCYGTVGATPKSPRLLFPQPCSVQNHSNSECFSKYSEHGKFGTTTHF